MMTNSKPNNLIVLSTIARGFSRKIQKEQVNSNSQKQGLMHTDSTGNDLIWSFSERKQCWNSPQIQMWLEVYLSSLWLQKTSVVECLSSRMRSTSDYDRDSESNERWCLDRNITERHHMSKFVNLYILVTVYWIYPCDNVRSSIFLRSVWRLLTPCSRNIFVFYSWAQ